MIEKVSAVMDGVEGDLLDDLEPAEREHLQGLLTSIWSEAAGMKRALRLQPRPTTKPRSPQRAVYSAARPLHA